MQNHGIDWNLRFDFGLKNIYISRCLKPKGRDHRVE
jgi:hypothetical protein